MLIGLLLMLIGVGGYLLYFYYALPATSFNPEILKCLLIGLPCWALGSLIYYYFKLRRAKKRYLKKRRAEEISENKPSTIREIAKPDIFISYTEPLRGEAYKVAKSLQRVGRVYLRTGSERDIDALKAVKVFILVADNTLRNDRVARKDTTASNTNDSSMLSIVYEYEKIDYVDGLGYMLAASIKVSGADAYKRLNKLAGEHISNYKNR